MGPRIRMSGKAESLSYTIDCSQSFGYGSIECIKYVLLALCSLHPVLIPTLGYYSKFHLARYAKIFKVSDV